MQSDSYLTIGFALSMVGTLGLALLSLLWMKNSKAKCGIFWVILSVFLILIGLLAAAYKKNATAQRNPLALSQTQAIQRLLCGEEVQIKSGRFAEVYATLARDNNFPESDVRKLGDPRRYYLRFDTNDTIMATNR